jgi:hypothetical protein
MVDFIQN